MKKKKIIYRSKNTPGSGKNGDSSDKEDSNLEEVKTQLRQNLNAMHTDLAKEFFNCSSNCSFTLSFVIILVKDSAIVATKVIIINVIPSFIISLLSFIFNFLFL